MTYYDQVAEAAAYLKAKVGPLAPRVGIVLGSGLGAAADAVADPVIVPYAEIPHFPQSTVEGHSGAWLPGCWRRAGDRHAGPRAFYEGYSPLQVTFPMRVLGALGIARRGADQRGRRHWQGYQVGQLVLLADHINKMGWNPLNGPNEPRFAVKRRRGAAVLRHDGGLQQGAARAGTARPRDEEGFALEEGVYLATPGPSFETPAEVRAFRTLGATLVGMSTVPETIVARHMGIEVLGISCVTNLAAGLGATQLSHQEVIERAAGGRPAGWPAEAPGADELPQRAGKEARSLST